MPQSFEYFVELPCEPRRAFQLLAAPDGWKESKVLGRIEWTEGKPWQAGSRRQIEMLWPLHSKHQQRVLAVIPDRCLEVISHGFGYTNHTQILLSEAPLGRTNVRFKIDIAGKLPLMGTAIGQVVKRFMEVYLEELRTRCRIVSANS
jgi:hypothetical protein